MARQFIYHMHDLTKTLSGGRKILDGIRLSFFPDAKIGVIGVNGAGKSTLLSIMAGLDKDFNGEAWLAEGATCGFLAQEPELDPSKTVRENVAEALADKHALLEAFNSISMQLAEDYSDETMARMTELQDKIDAMDLWELDAQIDQAMDALRCPADAEDVTKLSGGERRRVALCRLLLSKPDLLLLDEPTNHLDAHSVAWLENHLKSYPGAVLIVTHDRYFLDKVTGWILELDRGRGYPFEGNYSAWLASKSERLTQKERDNKALQNALARERTWLEQGARGRQTKSKARINAYQDLFLAANETPVSQGLSITIPSGNRLGDLVIRAQGLSKSFGDRLLFEDVSFEIPPGAIAGIIGANGVGKTTLFRLLTGDEAADSGTIERGSTVDLACVDQSRSHLDNTKTVFEEISDGQDHLMLGKREVASRAYCASFNFRGADQQKRVGDLSGGERNRVHLAKVLRSGANVILLDEPTNDLDVETLRSLEAALEDFAGCAMVISHDRWFLDRICTHILAFEDDGNVEWVQGNYADYEDDRRRRLGPKAVLDPRRIRHKRLTRKASGQN